MDYRPPWIIAYPSPWNLCGLAYFSSPQSISPDLSLPLRSISDSTRYCPTVSRECLVRLKGEEWGGFFSLRSIRFNYMVIDIILRRRTISFYPHRSYLPLSGPGFGAYYSPSCPNRPRTSQSPIWNRINHFPPNPSSFGWPPIHLSPPPQIIGLFSSAFRERHIRRTQTFPSGGGASRVHGSKMLWASFFVSINVLLENLIQGVERLQRPAGLFGSLLPASQITAQEAVLAVPIHLGKLRY